MKFTGKIITIIVAVIMLAVAIPVINVTAISNLTSTTAIHGNTIDVVFHSDCPISIDPSTPDYETDVSTFQGHVSVRVSSDENANGGIADSNGDVNVSLSIPENTPFVIRIYNGENYRIITYVDISNIIIDGESGSHSYGANTQLSGFYRYLCHYYEEYSNKTYEYWNTSNWSKVVSNDGWLYSDNGVVNINITAHYDDGSGRTAQNVFLDVILKN